MAAFVPIIAVCVIGGALQSLLGFGCAVVMMAVLPHFLSPLPQVAGMTSVVCMLCSLALVLRYRRPVRYRVILPVFAAYLVLMPISNKWLISLPADQLRVCLGVVLILISLQYLLLSGKTLRLSRSLPAALAVGVLSGILSGLFTMGGPPVVLYTMSIAEDKEEYLGIIQFYFTITNLSSCLLRTATGIITWSVLPWVAAGLLGIALGGLLGDRLQGKLPWNSLRRWVYILIGAIGASYLF